VRKLIGTIVVAVVGLGSSLMMSAPASAASTIEVSAVAHLYTNHGYLDVPLDPANETDIYSGDETFDVTIKNNSAEAYTVTALAPAGPRDSCAGTIAPGASLACSTTAPVAEGSGALDFTVTGTFAVSGADTTVASFPVFGVRYQVVSDDFAYTAPPPATGWSTVPIDPQLLSYPGLFRPQIRLTQSWDGNTPVTIKRATGALANASDECFGTLPKVVQPGDQILSCIFDITRRGNSWGFQWTGPMGDEGATSGSLQWMGGGYCTTSAPRYNGGDTVDISCSNFAPGLSVQARIWQVGVTAPQTVAADGTVSFSYVLPTITTGFPSGSLVFREGVDPDVESDGPVLFTIDPGVATTTAGSTSSGAGQAELAASGSDVSTVSALALGTLGGGLLLLLVAVRRRRSRA
jgi:hypothetical protein